MSDLTSIDTGTIQVPLDATLWHCTRCNAVISIHSSHAVAEAFCPACLQVPLEFCGTFGGIPGLQVGNA
jgi:hypothetical protein